MKFLQYVVWIGTGAMAASAWAHPGHGATSAVEPAHYITEPWHLAEWLTIGMIACGIGAVAQRRLHRRR